MMLGAEGTGRERGPICSIWQFPWCPYSYLG